MKCLIVAAGKGLRLRERGHSKPLIELCGKPLLGHVLENAFKSGVSEFIVVTGYQASVLEAYLSEFSAEKNIPVRIIYNPDYEKPNGLSVLCAREEINETFLLTMCDHLMDRDTIQEMACQPIKEGEVILATDSNLENPFVDLDDVTRVRVENGLIRDIGKGLENFNAFDTGLFLATPSFFDALEKSGEKGDYSISGGMIHLAKNEMARAHDIHGRFWIDVDSPEMFDLAEKILKKKNG